MIQTNCSKCGADLLLRDGYCVCNNCGEIYRCIDEEEATAVEEVAVEEMVSEEIEIFAPVEEVQEEPLIEVAEEIQEPEEEEEPETEEEEEDEPVPVVIPQTVEQPEKKKRSKAPIIVILVLLVVALGAVGGYFMLADKEDKAPEEDIKTEEKAPVENESEPVQSEEIIEEEIIEEEPEEEPVVAPEPEKKPEPAPVIKEEPKKETPAPEAPLKIAYRIRKSADDKDSQIGAFADLEKAKNFANLHAAEGYKVFDLDGNLVYQP